MVRLAATRNSPSARYSRRREVDVRLLATREDVHVVGGDVRRVGPRARQQMQEDLVAGRLARVVQHLADVSVADGRFWSVRSLSTGRHTIAG